MEQPPQSKYESLLHENAELSKQIEALKSEGATTDLQPQIAALHRYNEMKDLTQAVIGYLANAEQVSVAELHVRYNLPTE
ncbi:hypothetical protein Zmor_012706 [Zophobas morio]|uniref:DNA repair protein SWI5 homolog n=1 Tax=Zophobas morio TaxID=2755281 RepID=A0AA38IFX8_9CUCU|nr:hypothetical protein Zmor_012706 [Zophobas morio]